MLLDRTRQSLVAAALSAGLLFARDGIASGRAAAFVANPAWQAECGSCHVAYPPRLLPAASWRALMDDLERHFGTDASVDPAAAAAIRAFLEANAGPPRSADDAATLRITQTRWFVREHREVPARAWRNPSVRSAANCAACHRSAEAGRFGEHDVRIPQ
jgi:cytochrome c553